MNNRTSLQPIQKIIISLVSKVTLGVFLDEWF